MDNPPSLSFHIHTLFWQNNAVSVGNALKFKDAFATEFGPIPNCTEDSSAMIYPGSPVGPDMGTYFGGIAMTPKGPFLTGQYFWGIGLANYGRTVPWMMRYAREYGVDVFVHPVTGCDTQDHMERGLWIGSKWELDPSGLACDKVGCDGDAMAKKCTDHCFPENRAIQPR